MRSILGPLALLLFTAAMTAAAAETSAIGPDTPATKPAAARPVPARFATIDIKATIDGSDTITFSRRGIAYKHKNWGKATITVNGVPVSKPAATAYTGDLRLLETADWSTAEVLARSGRDIIALEKTDATATVYFGDNPNGPDDYTMKIKVKIN